MTARKLVAVILLVPIALLVGFCFGWGLLLTLNAILPRFEPQDGDTLREFVPVALAYLTWGLTSLTTFALGLRAILGRGRA